MEITNKIIELSVEFLVPLRMGDGFKEDKFSELCNAVNDASTFFSKDEMIPKALAAAFFDIVPAMVSSANLYQAPLQSEIYQRTDELADLIRTCLT